MPGKIVKPVLTDNNPKHKPSILHTGAIESVTKKTTRGHELVVESAMKSEKWKGKKQLIKEERKAQRYRTHTVKGWDLQIDDGGVDIIEMDCGADVDTSERSVVHEVSMLDLLKSRKPRSRDTLARDFEIIAGASSVIVLDDQFLPEPEVIEEDWERLELDDGSDACSLTTQQTPSYAEVAATR
ncbi:hypothetical protein BDY19DRAFT_902163 [Irpex rosettiformis]|uniref:Uncharacterized protein n=1 Tax=Irpex rosettiformis TaxID=378272 RepID=A0ACB8ULH2_9APHY|nr:hypothetical protein BDY19DRAFT_902163 [Irpex rosettiformis]